MTNQNEDLFAQEESEREETLGPILRAAREQKGMSIDDIAERLHLRPSIVKDIEADCFNDIASSTYARGYVRNFARIVEASEPQVMACLARQVPSVDEHAMQSFSRKTSREARDNRLMLVTYLIVAVLLTLLIVWWVQKSELLSGKDFSQPTVEEIAESLEDEPSPMLREPEANAAPETALDNDAEPAPAVNQPQLNEREAAVVMAASIAEQDSSSAMTAVNQAIDETALESTPNTPVDAVKLAKSANGLTALEVSLTGDCWIKATDATGKVLINDLKKSGKTISVTGKPPFKLVLGAPQVVSMKLDGESVDMSQFPRNRVARITVPVQG
ncbi:cytoskeleton protein RodZ [Shewanella gelidii]|uniref:Membrane protein n=1 Tax=Shewanella gelidii TaxID=1642821 RepID=A0A917JH79_9GAMM|nr:cytoskeleton protein RodZ [Shewanella gelidii]MCL1096519.1 cytoskeleton protein RodZ [Shewanella gelidii]GGI68013.1 membrane protein [Shewanella gelidii]